MYFSLRQRLAPHSNRNRYLFLLRFEIEISSSSHFVQKTSKMEILSLNRRIFKIFGLCSLGRGSDFRLKFGQIISIFFILINFYSLEYFSVLYLAEHYQMGDIDQNLFVLIQVIGTLPSIASFISLAYRMTNVCEYFDKIQNVFDRCTCGLAFGVALTFLFWIIAIHLQMKLQRP